MVENGQEPLFTEIASRGGPLPGSDRPLARAGGPGPRQAAGGVMPGLGTCLGAPLRIPGL